METSRWEAAARLCHAALQRPAAERRAFLRDACAGDAALFAEVESLLAHEASAGAFLESSPVGIALRALAGREDTVSQIRASAPQLEGYEVLSLLGVGGMGEVYRAVDMDLGRQVAIKILPDAFASDPERLARFEREAKTLASLNHPNIAQIYGFEKSDGVRALVMELVEGATLADRIAQGPIPIDEALPIARQIAEALEAAHENGIIHRDLKPANIKLRPDATVKVLDFGLAKALEPVAGDVSQSPTITNAMMTRVGVLLGTAAYMSPEQARGKPVDKRSDVWAFGCVLYEMLTSKQAFRGDDITETLASVVRAEPDWEVLPADTPPNIRTLLFRCLQKDTKNRVRDAGDIVIECDQALTTPAAAAATRPTVAFRFSHSSLAIGLAGLLLGGFITAFAVWRLTPAPRLPVSHLTMNLPPGQRLAGLDLTAVALSPDGRRVAYAAIAGGRRQLYLREMDRPEGKPIAGTEGAASPFFSPDGEWLGFFTDDALRKVPIGGGAATILARAFGFGRGASWEGDGSIVFASSSQQGLSLVSSSGGPVRLITTIDRQKGETGHRFPHHLPGGNALLFTVGTGGSWDDARIEVVRLGTGDRKVLIEGGSDARYVPTGHVVYLRGGALMSVPFDLNRLEVTGSPLAIVERILPSTTNTGAAQAAIADSGSLVYVSGGGRPAERTLTWVDRKGTEQPFSLPARGYEVPRLSPDGQRVALDIDEGNKSDVWVYEIPRGTLTRLTLDGGGFSPEWAPDRRKITYASGSGGGSVVFWKTADNSASAEERLASGGNPQIPASWSPSGDTLAFMEFDAVTGRDIWIVSPKDGQKPRPFLRTTFNEAALSFSPDGRWVAFQSDESGRNEVYVQPFPGPGSKVLVSIQGGAEPVWSRDGHELFYRSGDQLIAVAVMLQPTFRASKPQVLFEKPYWRFGFLRNYDVTSDGRRFLFLKESEQAASATHIEVVLNWQEELKRLVPTD
jgi:eukaryotic-like serine/threonine-protein kinase